jgi:integrator complex subunit 11
MLDCGMHMGFSDDRRFPDFSFICGHEPGSSLNDYLDCVIISHFHLGILIDVFAIGWYCLV